MQCHIWDVLGYPVNVPSQLFNLYSIMTRRERLLFSATHPWYASQKFTSARIVGEPMQHKRNELKLQRHEMCFWWPSLANHIVPYLVLKVYLAAVSSLNWFFLAQVAHTVPSITQGVCLVFFLFLVYLYGLTLLLNMVPFQGLEDISRWCGVGTTITNQGNVI